MRKRIAELDILRAVAAFAVVIIHVTASPMVTLPRDSRSFLWYSLANQWSRFSIPAFVLITGLVLFYGYGRRAEFNAGEFMAKRLNAIAIPYLLWTLAYMVWRTTVEAAWPRFVPNLLLAIFRGTAMYQLYFIVLIFQFYLLFPVVRPLARSRWLTAATLAALAVQAVLMWDTYYGGFTTHITARWLVDLLVWRDRLFPWWMGYFMVGVWLGANIDQALAFARRYVWWLLGASAALLGWMMLEYNRAVANPAVTVGFAATGFRPSAFVYSLVAVIGLLGFGGWVIERENWLKGLLMELGKHSFGIFLIHPAVLLVAEKVLQRLHLVPSIHLVVITAAVMTGSYAAARLIAALPFGHWIVGRS